METTQHDPQPLTSDDVAYEAAYDRGTFDTLRQLTAALPQTAEQARVASHAALLRWQGLADQARQVAWESDQYALQGDGLRVRCAADLLESGQVASQTQADKQASDHPEYKAYKAEARRLTKAKADAEHLRDVAYQALQNHREYLRERTTAAGIQVAESLHAVGVALGAAGARRSGAAVEPSDLVGSERDTFSDGAQPPE